MTSTHPISIVAAHETDLEILLQQLDAHLIKKPDDFGPVEATAKDSNFLSSGIPQITELIIALGSSGAIAALTTVMIQYFKDRPTAKLVIKEKLKDGIAREIRADNITSDVIRDILAPRP